MTKPINFEEMKKQWLKDPEFKKAYDDLELEYDMAIPFFLGNWRTGSKESDMIVTKMPGNSCQGGIKPLSDGEKEVQERLYNHVFTLSETIGERHVNAYDNLIKTADYIMEEFKSVGYEPQKQTYIAENKMFHNIWVEKKE